MHTKYFTDCETIERIKNRYTKLCSYMHPSCGGSVTEFEVLNSEYQELLKSFDGYTSKGEDNKERTYKYDADIETGLADKIGALLALKMPGVVIALIGTWIWTKGDTRAYVGALKPLGMKYSGDKESWYFHFGTFRRRGKSGASFAGMAAKYGYREFGEKVIN